MSKEKFINQMEPWFGSEEKNAILKYMEEGGWITEFKLTQKFEEMIAEYTGAKHCIVTNNGTISLTLAALAAGIKACDEVIVPNYTQIATPNSVKMLGATPVFVDVEKETLCLNFNIVEKSLTKKTKAIMLVTANGRYPQKGINAFVKFCKEKNLVLIEDAAQSLGSKYPDGRHQGTVGLIGSFSFSAPKVISTGQGGALITNDDEIASKLRKLKDFGRTGGGLDIHETIGFNFKFTDLQACIGIEQMRKLDWRVARKKEILKMYQYELKNVEEIRFFNQDIINTSPWFIDVLTEKREDLMQFLKENSIGSRVMYPPINRQKAYNCKGVHPISNLIGNKGLWLPSSSQLTDENVLIITDVIRRFFKR